MQDMLVGFFRIGAYAALEGAGNAEGGQLGQRPRQIGLRRDSFDRRQHAPDRLDPKLGDPRFVQVGGVHVADFPPFRAGCVIGIVRGIRTALDNPAQIILAPVGKHRENAVFVAVGGNLGFGEPRAVDGAEQIVLRTDGLVGILPINAADRRLDGGRSTAADSTAPSRRRPARRSTRKSTRKSGRARAVFSWDATSDIIGWYCVGSL